MSGIEKGDKWFDVACGCVAAVAALPRPAFVFYAAGVAYSPNALRNDAFSRVCQPLGFGVFSAAMMSLSSLTVTCFLSDPVGRPRRRGWVVLLASQVSGSLAIARFIFASSAGVLGVMQGSSAILKFLLPDLDFGVYRAFARCISTIKVVTFNLCINNKSIAFYGDFVGVKQ